MLEDETSHTISAYQRVSGRRDPCCVKVETEGGGIHLHFTTTAGSSFSSVTLDREDAEKLGFVLSGPPKASPRSRWPFWISLFCFFLGAATGALLWAINAPRPSLQAKRQSGPAIHPTPIATSSPIVSTPEPQKLSLKEMPPPTSVALGAISYLASPDFAGSEFDRQLLGDWTLEKFYIDTYEVLLSHPRRVSRDALPSSLFLNRNGVEIATQEGSSYYIGDRSWTGPDYGTLVLTHTSNLNLLPERRVKISFPSADYEASLEELNALLDNQNIYYKGLRDFPLPSGGEISNHGAYVAMPNESSLTRLVQQISARKTTREEKVQALLDFVANEITYSEVEALGEYETLKRPNEVLFTRETDCSGKAILFASLLEQSGEPYYLGYSSNHITVLVEKGNFPIENGYTLSIDGKTYVLAECTSQGFLIGQTLLLDPGLERIEILQRPSEDYARDRYGNQI